MFEKLHNKLMSFTWRGRGMLNEVVLGKTSHRVNDGFAPYYKSKV